MYSSLVDSNLPNIIIFLQLEEAFLMVSSKSALHSNIFFEILDALICSPAAIKKIGCEHHTKQLTASAITFFLKCRMHFLCRQANQAVSDIKRKKKNMAKLAKQTQANKASTAASDIENQE